MEEPWLLVLFVPGRRGLGALAAALAKHDAQFVEGCEEETAKRRYGGRRGLLLTLVGWAPAAVERRSSGADRVTLPGNLQGVLDEVAGVAERGFEVTVLRPADRLRNNATVGRDRLHGGLAVGCCYEVSA